MSVECLCGCKVVRKEEQYGLRELDDELVHRYRNEGASLRDLETYVNVRILDSALDDVGVGLLGSVEEVYKILTTTQESSGRRSEIRNQLRHAGLEIDLVENDFVSYQTIRTHLREHLNVETSTADTFDIESAQARIGRLESRLDAVVGESLERLQANNYLRCGEIDVLPTIQVTCRNCEHTYYLDEFLATGGCECGGQQDSNTTRVSDAKKQQE